MEDIIDVIRAENERLIEENRKLKEDNSALVFQLATYIKAEVALKELKVIRAGIREEKRKKKNAGY